MMNSEQLASHITVCLGGLPREMVRGKKRPKLLKDTAVWNVFLSTKEYTDFNALFQQWEMGLVFGWE